MFNISYAGVSEPKSCTLARVKYFFEFSGDIHFTEDSSQTCNSLTTLSPLCLVRLFHAAFPPSSFNQGSLKR